MILIENADRTEKNPSLEIVTDLMWKDTVVATFTLYLRPFGANTELVNVIQDDLMPLPISYNKTDILNWLTARGFQIHSHRNINFIEQALMEDNRKDWLPVVLSLQTNSVSISDKYWLNPHQTHDFFFNSAHIVFKNTTWDKVNPFQNTYSPCKMDEIALYDLFHFPIHDPFESNSLVWTTHGDKSKRWIVKDKCFYLEKKVSSSDLSSEIRTLEFFSQRGIMVPEYEHMSRQVRDDESHFYDIVTHEDGIHVITKKCFVDDDSYFISACYFVDGERDIESLIKKMCYKHSVKWSQTRRFVKSIKAFMKEFCVEDHLINTSNFGLLVRPSGAVPVVIGRLGIPVIIWNV